MADLITGIFHNRSTAESAVDRLEALGYEREEISVLMHDQTMAKEFAEHTGTAAAGQKKAAGAKLGASIGGALAAIVGGMAAKSAGQDDRGEQGATRSTVLPTHSDPPLISSQRVSSGGTRADDLSAASRTTSLESTSYGAGQRGDSSYVVTPSVSSGVTGARIGDTSSGTSQSRSSTPESGSSVVAGPLAATLAGAGLGGLIGALAGAGVDKKLAERYEKDLNTGGIVIGVAAKSGNDTKVRDILRNDTTTTGAAGTRGVGTGKTAREVMSGGVECVGENDTVLQAAKRFAELNVGALPICGEDQRLKGMLTDRDIVVKVLAKGSDPAKTRVGELGEGKPVTIGADDSLDEALRTMISHKVRRLPVIDGHKLVGIISQADLAKALPNDKVGEFLQAISTSP